MSDLFGFDRVFFARILQRRNVIGIGLPVLLVALAVVFRVPSGWWDAPSPDTPAPITQASNNPQTAELAATIPLGENQNWSEIDNPEQDGWNTESRSQSANAVLGRLAQWIANSKDRDGLTLEDVATKTFTCGPLVPNRVEVVFQDSVLSIRRPLTTDRDEDASLAKTFHGPDGLRAALARLLERFQDDASVRCKFKLYRIEDQKSSFSTRQYVSIVGRSTTGILEKNATWQIGWTVSPGQKPQVSSIQVLEYEQTETAVQRPLLADCTESLLKSNDCYRQQFLLGMNHWLERIQDTRYFAPLGNPGLTIGDVNGDGLDDLYVCQEAGLPNRLFLQKVDGTAVEVADEWGVNWLESSRSALLLDFDNDGDQDLAVAMIGCIVLAENDDQQRFLHRATLPTDDDTMSLASADYDLDGDLDVYICVDYPNDFFSQEADISVLGGASNRVYHDPNNAGRNSLFRNDMDGTDWRFTNVTKEVGLDVNNRRFSLAVSWDDYDADGDQDLYVANDFGRNNLYRNELSESGVARFIDVAGPADVEDGASGMSVSWGDLDRDGQSDVYVGNMFSAAGGRITHQPGFKPDASQEVKSRLRRFARGSSLFRNMGDGTFRDISDSAAVTVGRWAWGSVFADLNNDGWEDLVVANGYITTDDSGDL